MKQIFTFLFVSILFCSVGFAQEDARGPGNYRNTKFSVSVVGNANYRVQIDGRAYNVTGGSGELTLLNLQPGNHSIAVYVGNRGRSNRDRVIYQGQFYLREQYHVDMVVNRFGRAFTDEQYLGYGGGNTNYPSNPNGYGEMTAADFARLKQTLTNESFDNTRLQIATQASSFNYFTTAQAKEIIQLFSFDESRLEIAKSLYARVTDKGNYYSVADAFSYSKTKEDLMSYLRTQL